MNKNLNVVILGAGYGTRIASATNGIPKGLIPTENTTLIGRQLKEIQSVNQINHVTLVTNAKYYDQYINWLQQNFSDFPVTVLNDGTTSNENRLGALGDLVFAIDKTGGWSTDTLVLSSDTYYSFPLSDFLAFYESHPNFITVVYKKDKELIKGRHGCAVLDGAKIIGFVEKPEIPPSPFACVAFYLYPANTLPFLKQYQKEGNNMDAPGSIIPWLLKNDGPMYAMIVDTPIVDVGTPPDIETIKQLETQ